MLSTQAEQFASLDRAFLELQQKHDALFRQSVADKEELQLRVKAAEGGAAVCMQRAEAMRKEAGVWGAAKSAVEDELARLRCVLYLHAMIEMMAQCGCCGG
jgi:hypothetical protein